MAEEKTDEKTKKTVPGMERSFAGIAKHADDVLTQNWDKDKRTFRDPFTCWLALFTYSRMLANLAREAEERAEKRAAALEKRIAEFETRITTMERWQADAEAATAMMMKDGGISLPPELRQLIESQTPPALPPAPTPPTTPPTMLVSVPKPEANGEKKDDVA